MKKSTFKSLFLATISTIVLASVVKAEERVVAMVNGVPVLESQVQANIGKSGDRQVALDKIIDDIHGDSPIENRERLLRFPPRSAVEKAK